MISTVTFKGEDMLDFRKILHTYLIDNLYEGICKDILWSNS